ncbi:tryptophan 2,3-dioxygenase family protein, partial [Myxococcus sp. 1LA]
MSASINYSYAERLRLELAEPLFNPLLKKWVGKGELDYEVYLKTPTLLSLQAADGERVAHDELMFQVVHQAQELWLKLASREAVEVVAELDRDALWAASARLERICRVLQAVKQELAILETMTPDTYQVIRRSLGNGSGQESPGYNMLRRVAQGLEGALERLLARRGQTLTSVYTSGGPDDLKRICEQLVDMDEAFQGWLHAHFQLAWTRPSRAGSTPTSSWCARTIGVDRSVKALDGLPTQVLAGRMTLPLFRQLWDVRLELTAGWQREGGVAPGASR